MNIWAIHDLTPDPAEVAASRRFHINYWLGLAESAIAKDHRATCYGSLTANIKEILAGISDPLTVDRETVATLRHDLAFLEGHIQAYREIIDALRNLARDDVTSAAE